jgi:DNA-binding transcriptional LysR family regulator
MELRHLRYFVAVAEELHFGRAAERLFIVQSALSKQVAALEHELSVQLFVRSRRSVALTPAGIALLADARQVLAVAEAAAARAQAAGRGETGELRIGFIAPALYELLPRAVRAFREHRPDVRLVLEEMHNQDAVDAVAGGRLDVAFVRLPVAVGPELRVVAAAEEPVMLAVPEEDPLAARAEIAMADLEHRDLILIARSQEPDLHGYYVEWCAAAGFRHRVAHEVDRTHVAVGLVACGLGVCFVPCSSRLVAYPGVAYRPLAAPAPVLRIGAVWSAAAASPVLDSFVSLRPWAREPAAVVGGAAVGGAA